MARVDGRVGLTTLSGPDFQLVSHVNMKGMPVPKEAANIPMILWPDGRWCFAATWFMCELYRQGKSRHSRGGTLGTYAAQISHLIRFCFDNDTDLLRLTDSQFTMFIKGLAGQRSQEGNSKRRSSSTISAIGRACLDFLDCTGRLAGLSDFVGPSGQIRATRSSSVVHRSSSKFSRDLVRSGWHHHALPTASPPKHRLPIGTDTITRLRRAAAAESTSAFLRRRRLTMLKLLEISGGRRGEVAALTVRSVRNAQLMERPMLEMVTLKQRNPHQPSTRLIPISRHDLGYLTEYIEKFRRRVIARTCGSASDTGALLISERTGQGLRDNTITQELAELRLAAGIEGRASPHLFRHRFITLLFKSLIEHHQLVNKDEFRRALLSSNRFLTVVKEWTGHSRADSLEPYINLAFDELGSIDVISSQATLQLQVASFKGTLQALSSEIENTRSSRQTIESLKKAVDDFAKDLFPADSK